MDDSRPPMTDEEIEEKAKALLAGIAVDPGPSWTAETNPYPYDGIWRHKLAPMMVLMTVAPCKGDSWRWWLHVSVSHRNRIPSYSELAEVKRRFVGADRKAIQIFPQSDVHVSIHPNCLHLWCCLEPDGDRLPEFSGIITEDHPVAGILPVGTRSI